MKYINFGQSASFFARRTTGGLMSRLMNDITRIQQVVSETLGDLLRESMLANNYMEKRILKIRGITKSHPHLTQRRMEMTRYSLEKLREDTGVGCVDVQARMASSISVCDSRRPAADISPTLLFPTIRKR